MSEGMPRRDWPPPAGSDAIEVVVCIPTFRRPDGLRLTLESLERQRTTRAFAVVIVDNDARRRDGAAVASEFLAAGRFTGLCTVEPEQGNCSAINAAFSLALVAFPKAQSFLMIDDDEIAQPDWLDSMVAAAQATGADIVGGPVFPQLGPGVRPGLARHPAFVPAYSRTGPVPVIYGSGNCLVTRRAFARMTPPYFDAGYNFLGGGDTDFFVRARHAGMRFHWVAEAVITETVPPVRTSAAWLAARGLRIGAVNHRIERRHAVGAAARLRLAAKNAGILAASPWHGLRHLVATGEPMIGLHPILVALGRLSAVVGLEPQQYRVKRRPLTPPRRAPA